MKEGQIALQRHTINQEYINSIYENLVDKIKVLDALNQEYKTKQQSHFLQTFMKIIEKIGNELIKAQQAYQNIDVQVKKDTYYLQLAKELHFFRDESYNLKQSLTYLKEELKQIKWLKVNLENELECIQNLYKQKAKQNFELKAEIKRLRKQIRSFDSHFNNSSLSSRKNAIQEKIQKVKLNQKNFRSDFSEQFRSHLFTASKVKDSFTIDTSTHKKEIVSQSTSLLMKKDDPTGKKSFSETSSVFRHRKRLASHLRILPQQYIPSAK